MQDSNQEIIFVIAIGGAIGLLLVGFIITILYFYQRRQYKQEIEIVNLKEQYQKELLNSQLEMQENTMKQIGEELHDNIKHQLLVVYMSLGYLPKDDSNALEETIKENRTEINNIINDIAQLSHSLHTDRVFQIGLLDSMKFEIDRLRKLKTLKINYNCTVKYNYFDGQKSTFIFRMFQEVLQNILKHAKATEINIEVSDIQEVFKIKVSDNGIGFIVKTVPNNNNSITKGIGLINMTNRAKLIGGSLLIESELGKGTCITLQMPIAEEENI